MKHHEAEELSKCSGELAFKRRMEFAGEAYVEYRCQKCGKWIYLPDNNMLGFCFETEVRI